MSVFKRESPHPGMSQWQANWREGVGHPARHAGDPLQGASAPLKVPLRCPGQSCPWGQPIKTAWRVKERVWGHRGTRPSLALCFLSDPCLALSPLCPWAQAWAHSESLVVPRSLFSYPVPPSSAHLCTKLHPTSQLAVLPGVERAVPGGCLARPLTPPLTVHQAADTGLGTSENQFPVALKFWACSRLADPSVGAAHSHGP